LTSGKLVRFIQKGDKEIKNDQNDSAGLQKTRYDTGRI